MLFNKVWLFTEWFDSILPFFMKTFTKKLRNKVNFTYIAAKADQSTIKYTFVI